MIDEEKLLEFMGGVMGHLTGTATVACAILGHELGLYKAMNGKGAMSPDDLASAAGTNPRLTREWLDQQASVGFVSYDKGADRYEMSPEAGFALANEASPVFISGGLAAFRAMMIGTEKLAEAFRGDGGVAWGDHHPDLFRGTREFFRPAYQNLLVQEWLPAFDGLVDRLTAGIKVADIGCGHGVSTIELARSYPKSEIVGFDAHGPSLEAATNDASAAGLKNASFREARADRFEGTYGLICFFDCLHDMGDPVGIVEHAKTRLSSGGSIMLIEPFAHGTRTENHEALGGLMYGASTFFCTPCSLSQEVGRAIGAQGGEPSMQAVFEEAGYSTFRRVAETPFNLIYEARA